MGDALGVGYPDPSESKIALQLAFAFGLGGRGKALNYYLLKHLGALVSGGQLQQTGSGRECLGRDHCQGGLRRQVKGLLLLSSSLLLLFPPSSSTIPDSWKSAALLLPAPRAPCHMSRLDIRPFHMFSYPFGYLFPPFECSNQVTNTTLVGRGGASLLVVWRYICCAWRRFVPHKLSIQGSIPPFLWHLLAMKVE